MANAQSTPDGGVDADGGGVDPDDALAPRGELNGGASAIPPPSGGRKPVMNLRGQLRERGTRLPLVGQLVTIFTTPSSQTDPAAPASAQPVGFEATSDETGRFHFDDLAPGEWRVLVEAPGYYPFRTTEIMVAGQALEVTYLVERGAYNPFDVTVTGDRARKEVNRITLPVSVIDKIPGTAGDPLTVIQNLPGVARTPLFGGEVVVRGSAPQDTQFLVDGMTVPNLYHFGGVRSVLPMGVLESIDFQPGNFDSSYGRAIGGIFDVRVKTLRPTQVTGYVDLNLLDASLYLEMPVSSKAAIAFGARRSYIDSLLAGAGADPETGVDLVNAPRYYDYQLLANYRPASAHWLRLLFFGSDDKLAIIFGKPGALAAQVTSNRFDQQVGFYRGRLEYRYVPSAELDNKLIVSGGNDTSHITFGRVVFNIQTNTLQLRDTAQLKIKPWLRLVGGLDVLSQRWLGIARLPPIPQEGQALGNEDLTQLIETRLDGVQTYSPAAFAHLELQPLKNLLISAGARAEYFSRISQLTIAPRMIARYQVRPSLTVKAGVGLYYQEPEFDQTDPNFGNPRLEAERAVHASVGLEWKPQPFVTLDGTAFYKDLQHLVSPTEASVTDNGVTRPLRLDNGGVGRVFGFELLARHDFTARFAGWIAYTLSRSERRDSGASGYRLFDFDQTHILAVVGTYALPRNWQVGARFRFVSGTPNTAVIGSIYNNVSDQFDPTYGPVNGSRDPAFQQLDIRLDKKWIHNQYTATVYLDLQNVYNRANPEGRSYNFDYSRYGITRGLPVLPIIGFKAEF